MGALIAKEKDKNKNARDTATTKGVFFKPVIFTTWGGNGEQTQGVLRALAFRAAARNGGHMANYLNRFRTRLAVSIARDNARSLERQLEKVFPWRPSSSPN